MNANFNRYDEGPGSELDDNLQPGAVAAHGGGQEYKVYMKNIPQNLSEMGIRNFCNRFGKIKTIIRMLNVQWAIVIYGTLR